MLPNAELFPTLLPISIVALGALVTLASEPFLTVGKKHVVLPWIAVAALFASLVSISVVKPGVLFGIIAMDPVRASLLATLLIVAILGIAGLGTQLAREGFKGGEGYALMLLSLCGTMLMVLSTDLLALFVGMELSAIPIYALVGMRRKSSEANEGLFKYFVSGALFGAVFLYGAALWYGSTGSTQMGAAVLVSREWLQLAGFMLVAFAMLFKSGAAPFHSWVADAYTGASVPVTGFMATTVKIGALAGLGSFWLQSAAPGAVKSLTEIVTIENGLAGRFGIVIAIVGILSIGIGSFSGLAQTRVRRLMAFSAIANAGYLVLAFLIPGTPGSATIQLNALWYYLIAYALASGIVLAGISGLAGVAEEDDQIDALSGVGRRQPWFGAILTFALISLAGLPPAAGFLAKFGILSGLFAGGHYAVAAIALMLAVVAFAYYTRIVISLWKGEGDGESQACAHCQPIILRIALGIATLFLVVISIMPASAF